MSCFGHLTWTDEEIKKQKLAFEGTKWLPQFCFLINTVTLLGPKRQALHNLCIKSNIIEKITITYLKKNKMTSSL